MEEIGDIQARYENELPETVVKMLSNYGAFRFEEYVYYSPVVPFPCAYSKSNRGIVGTVFGKQSREYPKAKAISLTHQLNLHKDDFGDDFLPIADNGAGDVIGIKLATGHVQLWVHDAYEQQGFYEVRISIDEWVSSLENIRVPHYDGERAH